MTRCAHSKMLLRGTAYRASDGVVLTKEGCCCNVGFWHKIEEHNTNLKLKRKRSLARARANNVAVVRSRPYPKGQWLLPRVKPCKRGHTEQFYKTRRRGKLVSVCYECDTLRKENAKSRRLASMPIPTTTVKLLRERLMDCGDTSCMFRERKGPSGMRTNGGCRCWENMTANEQRRWAYVAAQTIRMVIKELET